MKRKFTIITTGITLSMSLGFPYISKAQTLNKAYIEKASRKINSQDYIDSKKISEKYYSSKKIAEEYKNVAKEYLAQNKVNEYLASQKLAEEYTKIADKYLDSSKTMIKSVESTENAQEGRTIMLLTPSVPINFSRLEKDSVGNWRIGPQMSIGGAYYFMLGKGYANSNGTYQIEPYFLFGISLDAGLSQNLYTSGTVSNLNIGCVVGIYKYLNIMISYDIINQKPVYGLGTRIDLFSVTQGAGTIIINKKEFFR